MTPQETLDDLAAFLAGTPDLEAATVARPVTEDDQPEARVLNLADDAEAFFRDVIISAVVDQRRDWSFKELDPIYKPEKHVVEWTHANQVDAIRLALSRYSNLSPLQPFQPDDAAYKKRLLFWVVVLTGSDERKAYFFRAFSANAELRRKRGAALIAKDGTFTRADSGIFIFDESIDCLVFGDLLFVLRKHDFRRIFEQLGDVLRHARDAADALHQLVPIANFEAFADACSTQAAMADKLIAVQKRGYFNQLSFDVLSPVIDEFKLKIPVEEHNGKPHLVFHTGPDQRWRILRLVDDDYLKSSMTDLMYEVNSKSTPPA